jgi:glycerol-3-phosphate dehydrogenase
MAGETVDLLIVGGGITGAGVARDAALRGIRVALVERSDFAAGTSSRSSKLIHGGVRYLQQGDVGLVIEAAEERRILRRIAPHLTQPRPMMVPAYGLGTHTKLNVGLWTYEKLASISEEERHRMLDRDQALEVEPGLRCDGLHGAALYPENLTDDARLVLANLRSAKAAGALVANYAEVTSIGFDAGRAHVAIRDRIEGRAFVVRARAIVNAAGPWSDGVRAFEGPLGGKRLHLTKGIHIVVRREDLPVKSMVVMQARDKRQLFTVPRGEVVYVGTTDTDYGATADYPEITRDDVDYVIDAIRRVFPAATWGPEKVVAAWAGLRPLVHEDGKKPSEISRKDEVTVGPKGMITIAGGKLTTYRKMAEKGLAEVEARIGELHRGPGTATLPLDGGDLPDGVSAEVFGQGLLERFGASLPGLEVAIDRLVLHYGSRATKLLERATGDGFLPGTLALGAEVDVAVEEEMAIHLTDVLERRMRLLLFDPRRGLDAAEEAAIRMARLLGWTSDRREEELAAYREVAASCHPR